MTRAHFRLRLFLGLGLGLPLHHDEASRSSIPKLPEPVAPHLARSKIRSPEVSGPKVYPTEVLQSTQRELTCVMWSPWSWRGHRSHVLGQVQSDAVGFRTAWIKSREPQTEPHHDCHDYQSYSRLLFLPLQQTLSKPRQGLTLRFPSETVLSSKGVWCRLLRVTSPLARDIMPLSVDP